MLDRRTFQNQDLVLKVSQNVDPVKLNLDLYEAFIDALCSDREYQADAIRIVLRYMLGGQYANLRELAEECYRVNPKLQDKYLSFEDFTASLQLPDQLSCSLDHATGTGKSFVMYGIARIMLAAGAVDRALVLCPSNTIERGLTGKFRLLSGDRNLKDLLPKDAKVRNPRIINASSTIGKGDICIENIHATYLNTKSAIEDSLAGNGARTLVLNDEAHHLMSPSDSALKKWKEFLLDPKYGFKYIVNVSGTCYIGDDYFSDVVHRFSLRDAIETHFVKSIRYVAEDSSGSESEKLQKIYDNHVENKKRKYRKVKPLTILVTRDIAACKRLTDKLVTFLSAKEKSPKEHVAKKVLIVTSAAEHKRNLAVLDRVDDKSCPVEWITSVSMLSEGWDVKNVLQIVPHEERAFNSKLLIAQVLGRGLRIPDAYKGEQPVVTVFNHDKWSANIKYLVQEVTEMESRVHSYLATKEPDYNFDLFNVRYEWAEETAEYPQEDPYELLKKGFITYESQAEQITSTTTYEKAISGEQDEKKTLIELRKYSVAEVVVDVVNRLRAIDMDLGTNYSEEFGPKRVREIVAASLRELGVKHDWVSEANRRRSLQAFGVVYRKSTKGLRPILKAQELVKLSTREMGRIPVGVGDLRRDSTVFMDSVSLTVSEAADRKLLEELAGDESLPKSAVIQVANSYCFKTPVNVAIASYGPERKFIKGLTASETAKVVDAWVKSPDQGFYSLEYSWRKGEHPKQASFNPDFFIKVGRDIMVVEIKMDGDVTDENKAKLRHAKEHFARVNKLQKEQSYHFKFLSPSSYDLFFKALREHKFDGFRSALEAELEPR